MSGSIDVAATYDDEDDAAGVVSMDSYGGQPDGEAPTKAIGDIEADRRKRSAMKSLAAWTAVEALDPKIFRDGADLAAGLSRPTDIIKIEGASPLPWESQYRGEETPHRYFDIVLGTLPAAAAQKLFNDKFGIQVEEFRASGEIILASARVNQDGTLLRVDIPPFGWSFARAMIDDLRGIGGWADAKIAMQTAAAADFEEMMLNQADGYGGRALTMPDIRNLYYWVQDKFGLVEANLVSRPAKLNLDAVRPPSLIVAYHTPVDKRGKPKKDKEPPPLVQEGFYLQTISAILTRMKNDLAIPRLLSKYLGIDKSEGQIDILRDQHAFETSLDLAMTPLGKWPAPGHTPLVALQQAAVNEAIGGKKGGAVSGHIIGVNGPPGTGKTTLLKDVVAGLIVQRAMMMATFEDPRRAFSSRIGPSGYAVNPKLAGYNVVVASANNAAVENISIEWQEKGAIAEDTNLTNLPGLTPGGWGTIAAKLGNSANCKAFHKSVWEDKDYGLESHFSYIMGGRGLVVEKSIETGRELKRDPHSVELHNLPGSQAEALTCYHKVRDDFRSKAERVQAEIAYLRKNRGDCPDYSGMDWQEMHCSSGLLTSALNRKREDLFVAAMNLHRAFCDAAPVQMRQNLEIAMGVINGGYGTGSAGDAMNTLSFMIPIWSTAFASMTRMTRRLVSGDIGWLIIDEAGQAAPQIALRGMAIARNSICVGDPIQVEPIVTINQNIISEIARQFEIDRDKILAPAASVQTFADSASRFCAEFGGDVPRTVGMPLLVHRRCAEPMFSISNTIGYDGLMVQATPQRFSAIRDVVGTSHWIDIKATEQSASKFCVDEWRAAADIIKSVTATGTPLDMYIVTPFRDIEDSVRRSVAQNYEYLGMTRDQKDAFIKRIGTVHKMQGREADTVIMLLGAQGEKYSRARLWAANQPNIPNVCASRAKENFYIIGDRSSWGQLGYFAVISQIMQEYESAMVTHDDGDRLAPNP